MSVVKKYSFKKATFKNLFYGTTGLVSFIFGIKHHLIIGLKLYPWGQNCPHPRGHKFMLNYIEKSSYTFL